MDETSSKPQKIEPPPLELFARLERVLSLDASYHRHPDGTGEIRIPASSHRQAVEMFRAAREALVEGRTAWNLSYRIVVDLAVSLDELRAISGIGEGPMANDIPALVRGRIEALENDLARLQAERPYIIGCCDGFDTAMDQVTDVLLAARKLAQATIDEEITETAEWETLADDIEAALAVRNYRVKHLKRGTIYHVVGRGKVQTSTPLTDDAEVMIYRGEDDGLIWVRPSAEFEDGRFVAAEPEPHGDTTSAPTLADTAPAENGITAQPVAWTSLAAIKAVSEGRSAWMFPVKAGDDLRGAIPLYAAQPETSAARDVLAERARQISVEGWTPEHDDTLANCEMAGAAACYALAGVQHWAREQAIASFWPWEKSWWKPTDRRRDLIKAGALIIAEIERIDRAAAREANREVRTDG